MLEQDKKDIRLTLSPFLKIILVVIAAALSLLAIQGFVGFGAKPLYAQSTETIDVNLKSIGSYSISGSLPITVKEFPYNSTVKVEIED